MEQSNHPHPTSFPFELAETSHNLNPHVRVYLCLLDSNWRWERSLDSKQLRLCRLLKPNRFLLILVQQAKAKALLQSCSLLSKLSCGVTARGSQQGPAIHHTLCVKCSRNPKQKNDFLASPQPQTTDHAGSEPG